MSADALYTRDETVPEKGRAKIDRVNLGLALLALVNPGLPLSQHDIAAWCGCSHSAIHLIEMRALRKLRTRLRIMRDPVLRDCMDQYFFARQPAARRLYDQSPTD